MGYYSGLLGFIQNQQGLGENQRQFNANFGEQARMFDNQFLEGQRQFDAGLMEDLRKFDNSFLEGRRQYDNSFLEGQRQYDNQFLEGQRQFDTGMVEDSRRFDNTFLEGRRQYDNSFLEGQRQFDTGMVEDSRRFDNTFLEGQRQYDNSFLEGQRQFDTGIGEQARQFNLGYGQDYDRILMDYLGQAFGIDSGMFQREAQAYDMNQGEMQRQFGNNAGLLGLIPQGNNAPLNVANAYGISSSAANQAAAQKAQERQQWAQTAGMIASMFAMSSRDYKDKTGEIDGEEALEIVMSLPVEKWKYKGDDREHIGTYAEEFAEATGIGDGKAISVIDYLGVLTAAVQEIARRAA